MEKLQEWVNRRVGRSRLGARPLAYFIEAAEKELDTIVTEAEMAHALRCMPDELACMGIEFPDGLHFMAKVKDPEPGTPPKG